MAIIPCASADYDEFSDTVMLRGRANLRDAEGLCVYPRRQIKVVSNG